MSNGLPEGFVFEDTADSLGDTVPSIRNPAPTPTPYTTYALGRSVGGPDEYEDGTPNNPGTNQGYGSTGHPLLTPGIVAVNTNKYPIGTIFRDADTGEAFLAADKHGNKDPNVVDFYTPPDQYKGAAGKRNLVVVGQADQIPADPEGVRKLLASYGKVPAGPSAVASLAAHQAGLPAGFVFEEDHPSQPANTPQLPPGFVFEDEQAPQAQPSVTPSTDTPEVITSPTPTPIEGGHPIDQPDMSNVGVTTLPTEDLSGSDKPVGTPINLPATPTPTPAVASPATPVQEQQTPPPTAEPSLDVLPKQQLPPESPSIVPKAPVAGSLGLNEIPQYESLKDVAPEKHNSFLDGFFDAAGSAIGKSGAGIAQMVGASPGAKALGIDQNLKFFGKDFTQAFDQIQQEGQANGAGYQVGSGIGSGLSLLAGGLPGAIGQVTSQAFGENYAQTGDAGQAALASMKAAPEMAAYWLAGGVAGKIVAPFLKNAAPLGKAIGAGLAATIANATTSAGIRYVEGQPLQPTIAGTTQDALFGLVLHGIGTGFKAAQTEAGVKDGLAKQSTEALQLAASDPEFRKTSPYRPALIDQELAKRAGKEPVLPPSNDPEVAAKQAEIEAKANEQFAPKPAVEPEVLSEPDKPLEAPVTPPEVAEPSQEVKTPATAPIEAKNEASGETPKTFGIAQRVYDAAGIPIQPGEGVGAQEQVQRGRDLLKAGADPDAIIAKVAAGHGINADEFSVLRARGEQLAQEADRANDVASQNPDNFDLAQKADDASNKALNWQIAMKPAATEWQKSGMAQQGETDLDTGSFTAIRRAITETTGKTPTKTEDAKAKDIAYKDQQMQKQIEELKARLSKVIGERQSKPPKTEAGFRNWSRTQASRARERIRSRMAEGRQSAGLDPLDLADHAIVGADYLVQGISDFAAWSSRMVKEFGDAIKPHLQEIFSASQKQLEDSRKGQTVSPEQKIWQHVKDKYIDQGVTDPKATVDGTAQDLGLTPDEVVKAIAGPKGKKITDEMYGVMAKRRQAIQNAKAWIAGRDSTAIGRAWRTFTRAPFAIMTLGHAVGMETHAGANKFQPSAWGSWFTNWKNQWNYLLSSGFHEKFMQQMERDPDFNFWKRAGLAIDPNKVYDPYQEYSQWIGGRVGAAGSRSMDSLKTFRFAVAKKIFDSIPANMRDADTAKEIAKMVNHGSGEGEFIGGKKTAPWLFAAKLEASRWGRVIGDPVKTAKTLATWNTSTPAEKVVARLRIQRAATFAATYAATLAINQALLNLTGSKQKINFTDATKADWMQHKGFGYRASLEGKVLTPIRFLASLIETGFGPKMKYGKTITERQLNNVGMYARGKLNPFIGGALEAGVFHSDFTGRPLPWSDDKGTPKKPRLSWAEYVGSKAPIPVAEGIRTYAETLHSAGLSDKQVDAIMRGSVSMAGGALGIAVQPDLEPTKEEKKAANKAQMDADAAAYDAAHR